MWKTSRTREVHINPRPIRVAYLVPEEPSHDLLDVLFHECMSRWGGRRTPIVPIDGNEIGPDYRDFLDLWDADIIYSYVTLSDELWDQIAFLWAPSSIICHEYGGGERDRHSLIPRFGGNCSFLSCLSILPLIAMQRKMHAADSPQVLDHEHGTNVPRDLQDSFGFVSNHLVGFSLLPDGRRLSYRESEGEETTPHFSGDESTTYVEGISDLLKKVTHDRSLFTMAQMSDMFTPYLIPLTKRPTSWEDHLTIVIGDEVCDRLLFWNAVHRYESLSQSRNTQVLRISPNRFEDGIPDWVMDTCSGGLNRRHYNGNTAPRTTVRSCSASLELLDEIAEGIGSRSHNIATREMCSHPVPFEGLEQHVRPNRKGMFGEKFPSIWSRSLFQRGQPVQFSGNEFELPLTLPQHLKNVAPVHVTDGAWAVDLKIEREEDHRQWDNQSHTWKFPRRLGLHRSVGYRNYGDNALTLPPQGRPTEAGELAIFDDMRWRRPTLTLPSDIEAFGRAVYNYHPNTQSESNSYQDDARSYRFDKVGIGDKGSALLGALMFFQNFPEAAEFLNSDFVRGLVNELGPAEPSEDPSRISELATELKNDFENYGGQFDYELIAGAFIAKVTNWVDSDNRQGRHLSYKKLFANLPDNLSGNEKGRSLDRCLKYLRERQFLQQGFGWNCNTCRHENWTSLAEMEASLICDICRSRKDAPVSDNKNIHFMLNPYVSSAFSRGKAQGPVIWCLGELAKLATFSFMFAPTLNIERFSGSAIKTDLDVLACIDGEINLIEVKSSFTGVTKEEIDQLLELAREFRPDYAGFAVSQPISENKTLTKDDQSRVEEELQKMGVRFRLMTLDGQANYTEGVPRSLGEEMTWTA